MRSHFKTRSPPASSLQSVIPLFHIFSVLVPTGFVLVGQKNTIIIIIIIITIIMEFLWRYTVVTSEARVTSLSSPEPIQ